MNENSKAPISTTPLGNTGIEPSVLERGIGENPDAKLRESFPDQRKRVADVVARKRAGQDGHARD